MSEPEFSVIINSLDSPLLKKDTNDKEKSKDAENDAIIFIAEQEADTLPQQDTQQIVVRQNTIDELVRAFRSIADLTPLQVRIIEVRYISLITEYKRRLFCVDFMYHFTRLFVSVGSVAVPAMLSIQSPTDTTPSVALFWTTWGISMLVTIFHNFSSIFRCDKKYFGIHSTTERLISEGWQYLELSGHYSGHHGNVSPTHVNQYVYFVNAVERIKRKQIEAEYSAPKDTDKNLLGARPSGGTTTKPPSPA
jgi:hypothetical protein